ncbi:MAG: cytochrome c3 family protein [Planctomycetota bacterium]|jgi:hypothetical protein
MRLRKTPLVASILLACSATFAQEYVGDTACSGCHANFPYMGFFDAYRASGHPWKLFRTDGATPAADTYPSTPLPPLPMAFGEQLEWGDVGFIIGNYFWKARFVKYNPGMPDDGYIWTGDAGDATQWNLATQEFVPYHPGEDRPYNCGRCHTTGYDPEGNMDGRLGLIGTWTEEGIRCEACHGPSSLHIADPSNVAPPGGKACSECHYRDAEFRMPWRSGFMRHHQQAEDFSHSPHNEMLSCENCHNPHRSTVYQDGGMTTHCSDCHPGSDANNFYAISGMGDIDCIDCHMPYMAKSAVALNTYKADVKGHIFRITHEEIAAADNVTDGFWNQDENGESFITLDYACLGCHEEIGEPLTLEEAAGFALNIHVACVGDVNEDGVVGVDDQLEVILGWGVCDPGADCPGDIDKNGVVGVDDLLIVILAWGVCE